MFKITTFKRIAAFTAAVTAAVCALLAAGTFRTRKAVGKNAGAALTVLMYHQISDNGNLFGDYVIPASLLEEDFIYMKQNGFHPVSVEALCAYCKNGTPLPEKAVLITFDDGQRSFLTKVVPLLEKYSYPAVVNIIGSLAELYTQNGETDDRYAYLNRDDIKLLSENPLVEIGNHSHNMHSLAGRRGMGKTAGESDADYAAAVTADIRKAQACLTEYTGEAPSVFAYPYGIVNDMLFEIVKSEGFVVTLTCRECENMLIPGGELYELGRFNRPFGISSAAFFEKITR